MIIDMSVDPKNQPITISSYPLDAYEAFENRHKDLEGAKELFTDSSLIANLSHQETLDLQYAQLSLENGDIERNRLFAESEPPPQFTTQALFHGDAIIDAFGPESQQKGEIEKIAKISEKGDPSTVAEGTILKETLELVAELNQIMVSAKNQINHLAKG